MKKINLITATSLLFLFQMCATKPPVNKAGNCFTGKLVKKGICGQRVVQLLSVPVEGIVYAENWTDTLSHKQYSKVFTVSNSCNFPVAIKEGEEFRFTLTTERGSTCVQCYAYTATPEEKNNILTGCSP